jgi:hypothetical protein
MWRHIFVCDGVVREILCHLKGNKYPNKLLQCEEMPPTPGGLNRLRRKAKIWGVWTPLLSERDKHCKKETTIQHLRTKQRLLLLRMRTVSKWSLMWQGSCVPILCSDSSKVQSYLVEAMSFLNYIQRCPVRISVWKPGILSRIYRNFSHTFQINYGVATSNNHDHVLPDTFQFIVR